MRKRAKGPERSKASKGAQPEDLMAFYLRNREAFGTRSDADLERSCASKDAYPTEAHARAVAAMNDMGDVLYTYQCFYCHEWHLTRRPPPAGGGAQIIDD